MRDPDQALDEVLDEAVLDVRGRDARDEQRQQEEDADAGDEREPEHQRDGALAQLDALAPRPGRCALRTSQRVPTTSVSYRTTRPRMNGSFDQRRAVEAGVEALGGADDAAVGWRRATAIASRPRIRTPSISAWPP